MTILDMSGKPCPLPVIETKKALAAARPGDTVSILVDNDAARQNLQKMAQGLGHEFAYETRDGGNILARLTVMKSSGAAGDDGAGLVVAVGRNFLGGAAAEEPGLSLMKLFILSLTELDTPPEHILLYNSGVLLSTEGAATIDDLAALTAKGTQIGSCGACLDHFKLKDKLAVGQISNMFAMVSIMAQARKLMNV